MNYLYLSRPMHIRQFDLYLNYPIQGKPELLKYFDVLPDGNVMAVAEECVEKFLKEDLIKEIRMGRKSFDKRDFEVKDDETLFRYLAIMVEEDS